MPTFDVGGGVPTPAVSDGARAANARDDAVDITVRVTVVNFGVGGGLEDGGSVAKVAFFEIKDAGAKFEFLTTVVVDDVDDDVSSREVFKRIQVVCENELVPFGVGVKDGGAERGHFYVVEAKESGGSKKKQDKNQK